MGEPHIGWMFGRHREIALNGPGAVAAARACLSDVLASGGPAPQVEPRLPTEHMTLVLARGGVEDLVAPEDASDSALRVVEDEESLVAEVRARYQRALEEHGGRAPGEPAATKLHLLLVFSPPLDPAVLRELADVGAGGLPNYLLQVVVVGGELERTARIADDGTVACDWYPEVDGQRVRLDPAVAPDTVALGPRPRQEQAEADERLIEVRVLGPVQVRARGREVVGPWRSKARELLALLAAYPEGLTLDQATEALFPDANARRARGYFRTVLSSMRGTLRDAAALPDTAEIVQRVNGRYRLDAGLVGVDLWRFRAASPDDGDDAEEFRGTFAAGEDFTWAEPIRVRVQQQLVQHFGTLAAMRRDAGDIEGALRAASRAVDADPDDEDGYVRVMDLQWALGRANGVRATYTMLEQRMSELGAEPSAAARSLLAAPDPSTP
jgi:DNA-binding SARP family transcriptional activator